MSQILDTVKNIAQFKIQLDKVRIEDTTFRLFSKVSVGCLILCAALVTMQQLVGEHIKCILPPDGDVRNAALNQYCFIMSTYTVPKLYNKTVGLQTAHYGVGPHSPEEDQQKYHYYYQWVPFVLFFQGLSFLIPHYLWKAFEEGRLKGYCELEIAPKISFKKRALLNADGQKSKGENISRAAVYFIGNMSFNKSYAYFYMICEWLNFVMVLVNFFLTNKFLGSDAFKTYGPDVLSYDDEDPDSELNPMNSLFPKVAKCDFHKYGPSGNLIRYDIMCVLALNIINEKIYVFLWFWFVITSIIGGLALIYRVILLFLPGIRNQTIRSKVAGAYKSSLNDILSKITYADWFVLKLISDNVDSIRFGELCESIKLTLMRENANGRISTSPPPSYIKGEDFPDPSDPLMRA